jgi:hypothetical protein
MMGEVVIVVKGRLLLRFYCRAGGREQEGF